jgi:D-serine deaminase-like pyridoxal phosphate-dependent protein
MVGAAPGMTGLSFPALPAAPDTPRVVLDVGRMSANIERLQSEMDRRGVAVRPHAKTHKSVEVARRQLAAGARGLTIGTLGEAEVFVAAGIDDLFLAYPIWVDNPKAGRLRAVHDAAGSFAVGIDSVAGAERLAAAVAGATKPLRVLVEVDPGLHRTGVSSVEEAVSVARAARAAGLVVDGVFSHGGHGYRPGAAEAAGSDEVRALSAATDALRSAGFEVAVVSAGSTPTMRSAALPPVTEIRPGTYVYGDRQQVILGAIQQEGCAVAVAATVVSSFEDRLVLDAGAKALTKDRADWLTGYGEIAGYPDLVIDRLSDYHGVVTVPAGAARPSLGTVVAVIPNHVCPVIDLFDTVLAVTEDGGTEEWRVDARGRSG